ncbi:hypothetical protein AB205_0078430, partial [Aquarana catesbeiana]
DQTGLPPYAVLNGWTFPIVGHCGIFWDGTAVHLPPAVVKTFAEKVQEEIQTNIKQGQMPTVDDRRNMPYTEAVVHEIQRFANIVPLNVPHTTPNDVYFRGYCIPKGTDVIPFLTSVLHDKTQWETPHQFNPKHFLNANGKFVKRDAFMPFSAGRSLLLLLLHLI